MEEEDRKNYMDNIQKDISEVCFEICSAQTYPQRFAHCKDTCFTKYIQTLNVTNNSLRDVAYRSFSKIAYIGYPEDQIEHLLFYSGVLAPGHFTHNYPYARRFDSQV